MIYWKCLWLAGFICAALPAKADPTIYFHEPIPQDLVTWVEARTGTHLPAPQQLNVIDNSSKIFLHKEGSGAGIFFTAPAAESDGKIYFSVRAVVHMQEESYRALIVHELVHVAQRVSKRSYACPDQYEAEAYQLQNAYLLEHGEPAIVSVEQIQRLQSCAGSGSDKDVY